MKKSLICTWTIITGINTIIGIVSWFDTSKEFLCQKIIIVLLFIIVGLIISLYLQAKEFDKLEKHFDDISQRHNALSSQFSEKRVIISRYEKASFFIESILWQAMVNTKEAKINQMATSICKMLNNINSGGIDNE